jgi:DNA mismatch repair protein MutL
MQQPATGTGPGATQRIAILPDDLADQIAAGEVVERPASVVKELLENAIDAGARRISVEIESGGVARLRVVDDGEGMTHADAVLSVRRHATSKLRTREDLSAIRTLGFRGEALPSIASVCRFSLITRARAESEGEHAGTRIDIEGGSSPRVTVIGAAPGTVIEARELFFNVPARLKFLKSRATETGHVANVVTRAGLAYPGIAFTLIADKRRTRELLPVKTFAERAKAVLVGEPLTCFEDSAEGVRIEAALGAPERARAGASGLHLLINGRPVRDASLARAIAYAYGSVLPPGRYPAGALHLTLDPSVVDVNVHPQKLEVRFANARPTFDIVTKLVARHLGTSAWRGPPRVPATFWEERLGLTPRSAEPNAAASPERPAATIPYGESATESADGNADWGLSEGHVRVADARVADARVNARADAQGTAAQEPEQALLPGAPGFFGSLRFLGQTQRTLLVCEGRDALYILDQHAADERVRYDRLRRARMARAMATQRLLFPERVELSEDEASLIDQCREELAQTGLECTLLGPRTVAVHTVPSLLASAPPERLLREVLEELERRGERAFSDAIDMALATMACHAAIRAGDALSREQVEGLLRNLDEVSDFSGHCPHGRPVLHDVSFADLLRKLGR